MTCYSAPMSSLSCHFTLRENESGGQRLCLFIRCRGVGNWARTRSRSRIGSPISIMCFASLTASTTASAGVAVAVNVSQYFIFVYALLLLRRAFSIFLFFCRHSTGEGEQHRNFRDVGRRQNLSPKAILHIQRHRYTHTYTAENASKADCNAHPIALVRRVRETANSMLFFWSSALPNHVPTVEDQS